MEARFTTMDRLVGPRLAEAMTDVLDQLRSPILLTATVAAGLQAGTYYTWACGVMPGLARVDDRTFVASMTQVNVAIVNPAFMLTFLGAPALAAAAVAVAPTGARGWAVAGLALALGTVAITAIGNVPLNDALADGGSRSAFETAWTRWNLARAVTSTASLACLAWAALRS